MHTEWRTTTVTTAGTEVQVAAADTGLRVRAVLFKARAANTGLIYVGGDNTVSSTSGFTLSAGESVSLDFGPEKGSEPATSFWVDSSVNGERVDSIFIYEI